MEEKELQPIPSEEIVARRRKFVTWRKTGRGKTFKRQLYINQQGECAICGHKMRMFTFASTEDHISFQKKNRELFYKSATFDHKVPIFLGGENVEENLQLTHWICNYRKALEEHKAFRYDIKTGSIIRRES